MDTDYSVFGHHSFSFGEGCALVDTQFNTASGSITIGNNVIFGHRAMVLTGTHDVNKTGLERRFSHTDFTENHIVIEDGVWIASGAIVLGPCKIGKNSVVGAGSLVLPGEYPDNVFIAGHPAKIIKSIGTDV